jgi:hypothetical protein
MTKTPPASGLVPPQPRGSCDIDTAERAAAVYWAIKGAGAYVPEALLDATGRELHEIVAGLVPGLFCSSESWPRPRPSVPRRELRLAP